MDFFTDAYRELREGIAKEGGVIAKKGSDEKKEAPKGKPDAKGGDKEKGKDTSDESRVKQAVYDIRYRAKREQIPVAQAMTDYLKHSGSLGPKARAELKKKLLGEGATPESGTGKYYDEKNPTAQQLANRAKRDKIKQLTNQGKHKEASALHNQQDEAAGCDTKKVKKGEVIAGVTESADTQKKGPSGDTLYKVRVKNVDGRTEIRYASRAKISQLRNNTNISSVEITGHGEPYNKSPEKKEKKASKDHDGDGKIESGSKEHAGAVHNAIQKKKGGKQDGKDTRQEEGFSNWKSEMLDESDIADILARLEKKRISKGGDPDESPLGKKTGQAMKAQQDKQRKKAGLKTEHHQVDADGNVIEHDEEKELDEADTYAKQLARFEAGRRKRMKQSQTYERPNYIPKDQDHSDEYGSSKGKKSTKEEAEVKK